MPLPATRKCAPASTSRKIRLPCASAVAVVDEPVVAVDEQQLLARLRAGQPDLVDAAVRGERRGLRVREVDAGCDGP